ncbi:MAG: hypothetical protein H0U27_07115, partial [Nitrosopumilus sp.]|nr:hypothetical protein [Nitrosopumilus sp.]
GEMISLLSSSVILLLFIGLIALEYMRKSASVPVASEKTDAAKAKKNIK